MDEQMVNQTLNEEISNTLKKNISYLSKLTYYRYQLLIYNLVKKGHVTVDNIAEDTGLSRARIYQIIEAFDKQNNKE